MPTPYCIPASSYLADQALPENQRRYRYIDGPYPSESCATCGVTTTTTNAPCTGSCYWACSAYDGWVLQTNYGCSSGCSCAYPSLECNTGRLGSYDSTLCYPQTTTTTNTTSTTTPSPYCDSLSFYRQYRCENVGGQYVFQATEPKPCEAAGCCGDIPDIAMACESVYDGVIQNFGVTCGGKFLCYPMFDVYCEGGNGNYNPGIYGGLSFTASCPNCSCWNLEYPELESICASTISLSQEEMNNIAASICSAEGWGAVVGLGPLGWYPQ